MSRSSLGFYWFVLLLSSALARASTVGYCWRQDNGLIWGSHSSELHMFYMSQLKWFGCPGAWMQWVQNTEPDPQGALRYSVPSNQSFIIHHKTWNNCNETCCELPVCFQLFLPFPHRFYITVQGGERYEGAYPKAENELNRSFSQLGLIF